MSKPKTVAQCENALVISNLMCLMSQAAELIVGDDVANSINGTRLGDSLMDQISVAQIQKKFQPYAEV